MILACRCEHVRATRPPPGREALSFGAEAALRDVLRELHRSNRPQGDSASATKGALSSVGREEGQLVSLARACDNLTVTLCQHIVEKEAFNALWSAGLKTRGLCCVRCIFQ